MADFNLEPPSGRRFCPASVDADDVDADDGWALPPLPAAASVSRELLITELGDMPTDCIASLETGFACERLLLLPPLPPLPLLRLLLAVRMEEEAPVSASLIVITMAPPEEGLEGDTVMVVTAAEEGLDRAEARLPVPLLLSRTVPPPPPLLLSLRGAAVCTRVAPAASSSR